MMKRSGDDAGPVILERVLHDRPFHYTLPDQSLQRPFTWRPDHHILGPDHDRHMIFEADEVAGKKVCLSEKPCNESVGRAVINLFRLSNLPADTGLHNCDAVSQRKGL